MKKNRTMRVAVLLMALTLMTSCFVGNTFAKYVTQETASDSARVAKWGVQFTTAGNPLFKTQYFVDDTDAKTAGMTVSVKSLASPTDNVVAPGTFGNLVSFGLANQEGTNPEVSFKVNFALAQKDGTKVEDYKDNIYLEGKYSEGVSYATYVDTANGNAIINYANANAKDVVDYYPIKYTWVVTEKAYVETMNKALFGADANSATDDTDDLNGVEAINYIRSLASGNDTNIIAYGSSNRFDSYYANDDDKTNGKLTDGIFAQLSKIIMVYDVNTQTYDVYYDSDADGIAEINEKKTATSMTSPVLTIMWDWEFTETETKTGASTPSYIDAKPLAEEGKVNYHIVAPRDYYDTTLGNIAAQTQYKFGTLDTSSSTLTVSESTLDTALGLKGYDATSSDANTAELASFNLKINLYLTATATQID